MFRDTMGPSCLFSGIAVQNGNAIRLHVAHQAAGSHGASNWTAVSSGSPTSGVWAAMHLDLPS